MRIRSYARAFPSDRRIYRIDRWAVPVPGGLPLAASVWFVALAIAVWTMGQLPGVGQIVHVVGWPAAVIVGPGAGALGLTRRCDDGRTLPELAMHRVTFGLRKRCERSVTPAPLAKALRVAGDTSLPGRVIVHGPGRVTLPAWSQPQLARNGRLILSTTATAACHASRVLQLDAGEVVEARA